MAEPEGAPPAWARGMVAALSRGDHRYVLRTAELGLEAAAGDPALLARVHTWIAQALAREEDLDRARDHLRLAIRAVKEAGDPAGLAQIRGLRQQIIARSKRAAEAPAARPLPAPDLATPLGRALHALAAGDEAVALAEAIAAREAAAAQGDTKGEVLALLAMARVPGHAEASLLTAHTLAADANEEGLVTAVAQAARELRVEVGRRVF